MRLEVGLIDVVVDPVTFMRVSRSACGSSSIIAARSTNSPSPLTSSRTFIFASLGATLPSCLSTFGLDSARPGATGANIASAALARLFVGSCSVMR